MFVSLYHKLKKVLEQLIKGHENGRIAGIFFYPLLFVLRVLIQIIVTPHFLMLGPFKTFITFARKDERGSWIDSYNDFIISNRITAWGIISLILIAVVAVVVFVYMPIFYI